MSRIQDILAKAERDGTMRRQPEIFPMGGDVAPGAPVATVDGTAALDSTYAASRTSMPDIEDMRPVETTLSPMLVAALDPHASAAEQYRAVRARLTHADEGSLRTLMLTSPSAGEGKSVTAANLALAMAQEIQRSVLLIDANLRSPSLHTLFGLDRSPGLAELLQGTASFADVLLYVPEHGVTILPAGGTAPFPTELLGSAAMRRTLDTLRSRFDRIVLDVPAVAPLADAGTVAGLADGIVMVVRAGVTQRPALDRALASLGGGRVAGIVLNEVR